MECFRRVLLQPSTSGFTIISQLFYKCWTVGPLQLCFSPWRKPLGTLLSVKGNFPLTWPMLQKITRPGGGNTSPEKRQPISRGHEPSRALQHGKLVNGKVFRSIYSRKVRGAWNTGQLLKGGVEEKRLRTTRLQRCSCARKTETYFFCFPEQILYIAMLRSEVNWQSQPHVYYVWKFFHVCGIYLVNFTAKTRLFIERRALFTWTAGPQDMLAAQGFLRKRVYTLLSQATPKHQNRRVECTSLAVCVNPERHGRL